MVVIVVALADRCSTFSYTSGLHDAMRSMANLVIVSFATSPINQSITGLANRVLSINRSINRAPCTEGSLLFWVLGAFYFIWTDGVGGGVIQRWCHVYTTYRCQGNGVRTREQLPWRLTTTTTYKNHQGNRENICKKEMMNQKEKKTKTKQTKIKRGNERQPPPCGREEVMSQVTCQQSPTSISHCTTI